MDTGTNLFDQSMSEMSLDYLDFGFPDPSHKAYFPKNMPKSLGDWWCIDGGSEILIKAMLNHIPSKPTIKLDSRINKISRLAGDEMVSVWIDGDSTPHKYEHVICTIPLGCLRTVDLTEADLNYQQKTAIRCCHYDSSTKVGIKFATRWWQQGESPIIGGSSSTDRPSRTIVYPSYGDQNSPGVMIASYTWAQDASREGTMIP